MSWNVVRREPYTEIGVRKLKCIRCGEPARFQWNICSDGSYRPVCGVCDIKLNDLVLKFMGHPDRDSVMRRYRETVR